MAMVIPPMNTVLLTAIFPSLFKSDLSHSKQVFSIELSSFGGVSLELFSSEQPPLIPSFFVFLLSHKYTLVKGFGSRASRVANIYNNEHNI